MIDDGKTKENSNTSGTAANETIALSGEIADNRIKTIENELLDAVQKMSEGSTLSLDLKGVKRIDSRGISLIVGLFKECTLRKVTLTVIAGQIAYRILSQIKLDRVITIKESD